MSFCLDPRLAADSLPIGCLPLSEVRLMNDARYPWLILVPRREGLREIYELEADDQQQLWRESTRTSRWLMQYFAGDKLNVAALGNVVAQLHLHHVVRRVGDAAWPAPVWARGSAEPYAEPVRRALVARLQQGLQEQFGAAFTLAGEPG